jgi:hypothetical protein
LPATEIQMRKLLPALVLLIHTALSVSPARAQGPQFVDPQMTYTFGGSMTFSARLDPPQDVTEALIFISTAGRPDAFTDQARYDPGTGGISYTYIVQPGVLRPFSDVVYEFKVTLTDGNTFVSPLYSASYADDRFNWQRLEAPEVTVHWYQGGADFGQQAVDAARAGLVRIHEILPVSPSEPPDVYIYATPGDLQSALELTDAGWAAGEASPELGAAFVSIPPSAEQRSEMERQIPHELAHLLHYQLAGAGWANQPAWLREGIASSAERNPNPDYARVLQSAAAEGTLVPLAGLCAAFPPGAEGAFLAYAESESFVRYLLENYGASGLETLTRAYADGLGCEQGSERAFGAPLTELEGRWLADTLQPAASPQPAEGQQPVASQPAVDNQGADTASATNLLPFLVLLGLVLLVPLALAFSGRRRNGE